MAPRATDAELAIVRSKAFQEFLAFQVYQREEHRRKDEEDSLGSVQIDDSLEEEDAASFHELDDLDEPAQEENQEFDEWEGIKDDPDENDSNGDDPGAARDDLLQPPNDDIHYESIDVLIKQAKKYTAEQGYALTIKRSIRKQGITIKYWLRCDRGHTYNKNRLKGKQKRDRYSLRSISCPFECVTTHSKEGYRIWVVKADHNHSALPVASRPSVRKMALTPDIIRQIETHTAVRIKPSLIINYLLIQYPDLCIKAQDIYNYRHKIREKNLGGKTPLHALLDGLADSDDDTQGFYDYLLDEHGKIIGLFWSPGKCEDLLFAFHHVLIFDCTYRTNQCNIALFDIVGFNCMHRTFYGGFCFLAREREEDYI